MFEGWGAAVVGAAVVGGVAKSMAAKKAAGAQTKAANKGIDAENYRFDQMQALLKPYTEAGTKSLTSQQDLAGANGPEAQKAAIEGIKTGSEYTGLIGAGEDAILQNASATGGLRGGNTQDALAKFRPQLLSGLIDKQYQRLSGLTQIGENAAAGTGAAGMQNGQDVARLYGDIGAARAGSYLATGQAIAGVANTVGSIYGGGGKVF